MKLITIILLMFSILIKAAPINQECEINPLHANKDCPNDPMHIDAYEMDYMNFAYAWDKSYGTARVSIVDTYPSIGMIANQEFSSRIRSHDNGSFYRYRTSDLTTFEDCNISEARSEFTSSRSKGNVNSGQSFFYGMPDIFINEIYLSGNKKFIEIAKKIHINANEVIIQQIQGSLGGGDIVNYYNLSIDFSLGEILDGYNLYSTIIEDLPNSGNLIKVNYNNQDFTLSVPSGPTTPGANEDVSSIHLVDTDCRRFNSNIVEVNSTSNQQGFDMSDQNNSGHGGMILSMFAANTNNNLYMSSICRECSIGFHYAVYEVAQELNPNESNAEEFARIEIEQAARYRAFTQAINQGTQIINLSGYLGPKNHLDCQAQQNLYGQKHELCSILELAKLKDIVVVSSGGNHKTNTMDWPANESEYVIGVGGTDSQGRLWDEANDGGSCPNNDNTDECGSQYVPGSSGNIMAPAQDILVYHENGDYNQSLGCHDANYGTSSDGYQFCSGTSFSAPIISGIVAIMKSLNPLLSFDDVKQTLANNRVFTENNTSYAIPNISSIIKTKILGFSNGARIANRVKPMFRLKHDQNVWGQERESYLSTSIPQLAMAALGGTYMVRPNEITAEIESEDRVLYTKDNNVPYAVGYNSFAFGSRPNARAAYYIFGGHENPFTGVDDMIPLYHFAYRKVNYQTCDANTDHGYATNNNNEFVTNNYLKCSTTSAGKFYPEGIEGYLMPTCPITGGCYEHTENASAPQCLKIRYSNTDKSHALYMESEQSSQFSTYTTLLNTTGEDYQGLDDSECLGYVFPNVDSDNDLIIDGMELVLGTNPNDADSDDDGLNDGVEYPPAGTYLSDPLIPNQNNKY